MKFSRLLLPLLLPLLLTACDMSDQQRADYASVQRSDVSRATYDKMLHGDDLSLYDIRALSHAGVNQAVILRYLRDHGSVYVLNSNDVTSLQKAGVSESIIDYMMETSRYNTGPDVYIGLGDPFWYGPGPYYYGRGYYGGGYHHWH